MSISFETKMRRIYQVAVHKMPKDGSFTPAFIDKVSIKTTDDTKDRIVKTNVSLSTLADFMLEALKVNEHDFDRALNGFLDDTNIVIEYEQRNLKRERVTL